MVFVKAGACRAIRAQHEERRAVAEESWRLLAVGIKSSTGVNLRAGTETG